MNNAWILDLMWIQIEIWVWICFIWYWFRLEWMKGDCWRYAFYWVPFKFKNIMIIVNSDRKKKKRDYGVYRVKMWEEFNQCGSGSLALGWVWADNVALEAMRGSWGNNWLWSDQSATQDDLRTPAGRNPITAATDSDRWVQCSAQSQHKSQAIEVTGKKSPLR